ncbi:bifunctional diaminohydroxyphosphoribosylaminopyrimidine deaminase/5-amino-6-(5-phosphoribosylamino)uracil reductase RibD [Galbibacter mesophilus]|uniref:bifunctional diaminohydroxyphosphoribosylaminopyrimidine deaminase/5-amino-6-(5-phosphoribosylamino)uracil reductase RibD n=1 Tax=Galbibacter mesophilus TaxID=379069 RepID=UPI00191E5217|nr:bifunctional diaminohydroxyphosphoribosylaminopyrimidine deaminase/5-amino-6-(5-phosphoribosylamino)uracil reductase RibD [Galbibacter mesophilus]MCM5663787.1 bifunctional diaminohydroxyphosphoribosylaminopyrimidine deaminase/5-amino-6-(5-phosphoribosylamino)uracil reductase RibD [Galbibacter mesophilus]
MKIHEIYIKRCIELAKNGLGNTYPNPMVGCVIVADGKIIGEGYTSPAGQNHAEVNAIQSVKDRSLLKKATIYVTLEPCSHYGKTPPCADLIIKNNIPNVVIGTLDPHDKVCGRGVQKLMEAGHHVTIGVLEGECKASNKRFLTFIEKKRPYIILKWAQSDDGFLSPKPITSQERKPIWITNAFSRQLVHKWRTEEHGILVGTNTVVKDNPKLNSRDWQGNSPTRIVIDRNLRTPKESHVWDDTEETIFITDKKTALPEANFNKITFESVDFEDRLAEQIVEKLYQHNIQSLIVEGGGQTLQTFIDANLWDEARVFTGNVLFDKGTPSPKLPNKELLEKKQLGEDVLKIYSNKL